MFLYAIVYSTVSNVVFLNLFGIIVLVVSPQGVQGYLSILPFVFLHSPLLDVELDSVYSSWCKLNSCPRIASALEQLLMLILTLLPPTAKGG